MSKENSRSELIMERHDKDKDKEGDEKNDIRAQTSYEASTLSHLFEVLGDRSAYSLFEAIAETRSNGLSKVMLSKANLPSKISYSKMRKLLNIGLVYKKEKIYRVTPFAGKVYSSLKIINDAISILPRLRTVDAILPSDPRNLNDNILIIIDS